MLMHGFGHFFKLFTHIYCGKNVKETTNTNLTQQNGVILL